MGVSLTIVVLSIYIRMALVLRHHVYTIDYVGIGSA